jgi:hypothetical protein
MALVRHHPAGGTNYQPGVDVHGKYVAPADLPDSQTNYSLPDRVTFDLKINPMMYGQVGQSPSAAGKYANTALPVAKVSVDLKTGQTLLNGRPLEPEQEGVVLDACRKAGFR